MPIGAWSTFFAGQLSAAAAFAGLLFVSLSVNQDRILELERLADRGLEALVILMFVITTSSAVLVPGQPPRLVGAEIIAAGAFTLTRIITLQKLYLPVTDKAYRGRALRLTWINRAATGAITLGGVTLLATGDPRGLYIVPVGIVLSFFGAGLSAWILLIEINR